MPFFKNTYFEIWEPYTSNDKDPYTNEKITKYELRETIPADFQPLTSAYMQKEFGKILQDAYKVYIDVTLTVTPNTILREQGKTDTYIIRGTPILNNHVIPHIKLIIEKQRVPTKLWT